VCGKYGIALSKGVVCTYVIWICLHRQV